MWLSMGAEKRNTNDRDNTDYRRGGSSPDFQSDLTGHALLTLPDGLHPGVAHNGFAWGCTSSMASPLNQWKKKVRETFRPDNKQASAQLPSLQVNKLTPQLAPLHTHTAAQVSVALFAASDKRRGTGMGSGLLALLTGSGWPGERVSASLERWSEWGRINHFTCREQSLLSSEASLVCHSLVCTSQWAAGRKMGRGMRKACEGR